MKIKHFKQYTFLYQFDNNFLKEIISKGTLQKFAANQYIFYQTTFPEFYYLLLTGTTSYTTLSSNEYLAHFEKNKINIAQIRETRVSCVPSFGFRKKINKNDKIKINNNNLFYPGTFFGEIEFVYDRLFKYSLKSNEDSIFLIIPKDYFNKNIKNKIYLIEDQIKDIILKNFKSLKQLDRRIFNKYFQNTKKIFVSNNQIILKEKQIISNFFYIIYIGNCIVNSNKYGNLIYLQEGDIFGDTERIRKEKGKNINKEIMNKVTIKYNIISKSKNTILLQIYKNIIPKKIIESMMFEIRKYTATQERIIMNCVLNKKLFKDIKSKYEIAKNKEEVNNREKNKKNIMEDLNDNKITKGTNKKVEKFINSILSDIYIDKKSLALKKQEFIFKSHKSILKPNKLLKERLKSMDINFSNFSKQYKNTKSKCSSPNKLKLTLNNLNLFKKNKLSRNSKSEMFVINSYTDNFNGTINSNGNKNYFNRKNNNYSLSSNSTKNIKINNWNWDMMTNNSNDNFVDYKTSNRTNRKSLKIMKNIIKEKEEKQKQEKNNIIYVDGLNLMDRIKSSNIERLFSPRCLVNQKYRNIKDDGKDFENKFYGTDKFYLPLYVLCSPIKQIDHN